ncbi:ceramide kinase-like protein [Diadema setosum]|uniref:ceramide kinase-like protein n=1 Tax=Diadema setosum TaxID=31175 RepID=UPI003B3B9CA1
MASDHLALPAPTHRLSVPYVHGLRPSQRSASSPQLHRGSKVDLRDLLNLSPSLPLRGIFDIGKGHFDVVLEQTKLSWTPLGSSSQVKGETYPKEVRVRDIFAVQIQRIQRAGQEDGGHPRGVSIFVVHPQKGVANGLAWEEVLLSSTNENCCQEWFQAILGLLNEFTERPKRLTILIDTLTNNKAKHVYEAKIKRLLHFARIETNVRDTTHAKHAQGILEVMDFHDVDGVVCIGGDTIVNEAVNGLLCRAQRDANVTVSQSTPIAKCRIPLGIIPVGLFNVVAHSSQGISDPITSLLHIILGHIQPLDVCSVHNEAGFLCFGFSAMYGFGSDCLRRMHKSQNVLKSRAVEFAMAKSLLKLRTYECEVSYLPSHTDGSLDVERPVCLKGCKICQQMPELSNLVHSTPIPLRRQDSPLVLRRHNPNTNHSGPSSIVQGSTMMGQGTSPYSSPRGTPVPSPRASPQPSPMVQRRSPSFPVIAWGLDEADSTSEECLVTPRTGKERKRSLFKAVGFSAASSSAPNSRPGSAGWGDTSTRGRETGARLSGPVDPALHHGKGVETNPQRAFYIGGGHGGKGGGGDIEVPKLDITHAAEGSSGTTQRGIGILPSDTRASSDSDKEWRTFQDSFLNVGVVTLPNRSHLVPQGQCPLSHLADGSAHLILVRKVNRKEFARHLQHHGSNENQFDFPFVWTHEVKAIKIRPVPDQGDLKSGAKFWTWNIDMDMVQAKSIEMRVHHQLLAVFGEGINDDDFPTTSCLCL